MEEKIFTYRQVLVRGLISFTLFLSLVVPSYYAWKRLQAVSTAGILKDRPANRPGFAFAANTNRKMQRPAARKVTTQTRAEKAFRRTSRTDTVHRALSRDLLFFAAFGRIGQLKPDDSMPPIHYPPDVPRPDRY